MLDSKEYLRKFNFLQPPTIKAVREVASRIRPGQTETEIANMLKETLAKAGLKDHWYPILVHAGPATAIPVSRRHHLPSPDTRVEKNDILILDVTPLDKTVWSNWSETFTVGSNPFFEALARDTQEIVDLTYEFAKSRAENVGALFDFCCEEIARRKLKSIDSRDDVGHSIFQVPEGQTVDKTPLSDRLFLNEDYRKAPLSGLISIEPHLGRLNPADGKMYGAKQQRILFFD